MKLKTALSLFILAGTLLTTIPQANAYVDSLGRVFPGPKPAQHKIVTTKKKTVAKPVKKVVKKMITKKIKR